MTSRQKLTLIRDSALNLIESSNVIMTIGVQVLNLSKQLLAEEDEREREMIRLQKEPLKPKE